MTLEFNKQDPAYQGLTIRELFAQGHAGLYPLEKEGNVAPNEIYVNESRRITINKRPPASIFPDTPQGTLETLAGEVASSLNTETEAQSQYIRRLQASTLLRGKGLLVHPSIYDMAWGDYFNKIEQGISMETKQRLKEMWAEMLSRDKDGHLKESSVLEYAIRKAIPVIGLAHQFLSVFVSEMEGLEESVFGFSPVVSGSFDKLEDHVGYKDYDVHYVVQGKSVAAERIEPPNVNRAVPIQQYRLPFSIQNIDGVELNLPQEGLAGTFKVATMIHRRLQTVFTGSFLKDLAVILSKN